MGKTRRSNKTYGLQKTKMRITPKSDGAGEQVLVLQKPLNETLDEIETFARGVLKDGGFSTNWLDHIQKEHPEISERCFHAVTLLSRLRQVRNWLKLDKTRPAVFETMNMMRAMQDLVLTDMEPDIYRGKENLKHGSKGGTASSLAFNKIREKRISAAKEIWKKHPSYTVLRVAKIIAEKTGDTADTIRKSIEGFKPKKK